MAHNPQKSKENRINISLTGESAKLLRELHTYLKHRHTPVKVATTDVIAMALVLLKADLLSDKFLDNK